MSIIVSDTTPEKESKPPTLPILLAGPILRRADPKQVCIWIACSRPAHVTAEIFRYADLNKIDRNKKTKIKETNDDKATTTAAAAPIGLGTAKSLRLGEHLHIALIVAHPFRPEMTNITNNFDISNGTNVTPSDRAEFPTDELLAYDIEVTYDNSSSDESHRLKDFGLLNGKNSIAYRNHEYDDSSNINDDNEALSLPTFFLRGQRTPLNILHGSCRKLHGKGEDCLAAADELISFSVEDVHKRPSALFLTGDQIYADDVSGLLIQYLTQLSIKLIGYEEEIDGIDKKISKLNIGERQELVQKRAGFTSDHACNHLLGFGEFSAMYLLA
jgi:hypothetical protein